MKRDRLEDYELFYLEISQSADYLDGIGTGIDDEHEPNGYDEAKGLSDDQVSKLVGDQLDSIPPVNPEGQEELFSPEDKA